MSDLSKSYRMRSDATPKQIEAMLDALNPFYAFGAVLDTANELDGSATIICHGTKSDTLELSAASPECEIISVCGAWEKTPASYVGPTLTAKDFFVARDAFLACVESIK